MIYGIGTDILATERIVKLHQRYGEALAKRLLADSERAQFAQAKEPARFLAKRFAAKEAFAKAVGTGIRGAVAFRNIAVAHDSLGKPVFACAEPLQQWLNQQGIARVHLSLSDEREQVIAFAVAERGEAEVC